MTQIEAEILPYHNIKGPNYYTNAESQIEENLKSKKKVQYFVYALKTTFWPYLNPKWSQI